MKDRLEKIARAFEQAARHLRETAAEEDADSLERRRSSSRRASRVLQLPNFTVFADFVRAHRKVGKDEFISRLTCVFLVQSFRFKEPGKAEYRAFVTPESDFLRRVDPLPEVNSAPESLAILLDSPLLFVRNRSTSAAKSFVSLGRTRNCDMVLELPSISKLHAYFSCVEGEWFVTDSESKNGTFVHGKRLEPKLPYPISNGTYISFGLRYRFLFLDAAGMHETMSKLAPLLEE